MRAFLIILVLIAIVVTVVAFQQGWLTLSTRSEDHRTDVTVSPNKVPLQKDRDEFHQQADAKLKAMEKRLDDLKAQAQKADDGSRSALQVTIAELRTKYESAKAELRDMGSSAQERWEASRTKLAAALDDLQKGLDKAASRFK